MEGNMSNTSATIQSDMIVNDRDEIILTSAAISVLMVMENILGLVVIRLHPVLHTTANTFVCSMAFVDIASGIFNILANLFSEFRIRNTFSGADFVPTVIDTLTLVVYTFLTFSIVHMTIIAFERYVFIAHPFVYRRRVNNKTIAIILAMFWIFCVTYLAVQFGANSYAIIHSFFSITSTSKYNYVFFYFGGCLYQLCSILTAIAYGLIVKVAVARNRLKRERNHITQADESSRNALKTIKFFMAVYGLFAILTLPTFVFNILNIIFGNVNKIYTQVGILFILTIPGINFFVLFVLNADFRSALKKTLAGLCGRHR